MIGDVAGKAGWGVYYGVKRHSYLQLNIYIYIYVCVCIYIYIDSINLLDIFDHLWQVNAGRCLAGRNHPNKTFITA